MDIVSHPVRPLGTPFPYSRLRRFLFVLRQRVGIKFYFSRYRVGIKFLFFLRRAGKPGFRRILEISVFYRPKNSNKFQIQIFLIKYIGMRPDMLYRMSYRLARLPSLARSRVDILLCVILFALINGERDTERAQRKQN